VTFKERYGWELGLQLEYQLNPKLHLTASTHFQRNVYSGKGGTNEALAAIEVFEDSASEDALEFALDPMEVSVGESDASILFKQNMINYQLGANYLFRNNKKWRPYLGLSLSATSILKQSLYGTSELEDVGTGNQRLYNGKLAESKPGTSSSFRFTGLIPKAGFQLALNSKMNWQTEAWYRQGFNKNKDYLYGVLGLRTGVSYRF